jgi:integrase
MGRRKTTGLFKKRGIWQIDKQVLGRRIRMSTGTENLNEAELILSRHIENVRRVIVYGEKPKHYFQEAMERYLIEKAHKATISEDARELKSLGVFFNDQPLEAIHMGSLRAFIDKRTKEGVKNRTINKALQAIRHLLNMAASEWLNDDGRPWLDHAPKIRLLPQHDEREPYPISWDEQESLFSELSEVLRDLALFLVNSGVREQVACQLRWDWEVKVEGQNTSYFVIPKHIEKNRQSRIVVLNDITHALIEKYRGIDLAYVFVHDFRGQLRPYHRINNKGWRSARKRVNLTQVRVHDLKHTFGRRLRAAGVSFEDRQDLLGHKSGRITSHYSVAEINNLIVAANSVCHHRSESGTVIQLKKKIPHHFPTVAFG